MKVGISCIITPPEWTLAELLENCASMGYEAVELSIRAEGYLTLDTKPAELTEMVNQAATATSNWPALCLAPAPEST